MLEPHSRASAAKLKRDLIDNPDLGKNPPAHPQDHHGAQLHAMRQAMDKAQKETGKP